MALGMTALRLVTGVAMAGHGLRKLTHLFEGGGPEQAAQERPAVAAQ